MEDGHWANPETRALYLWLTEDIDLYTQACHYAQSGDAEQAADMLRMYVQDDLWPRLPHMPDGLLMMRSVGSLWRVDYGEITAALRAE